MQYVIKYKIAGPVTGVDRERGEIFRESHSYAKTVVLESIPALKSYIEGLVYEDEELEDVEVYKNGQLVYTYEDGRLMLERPDTKPVIDALQKLMIWTTSGAQDIADGDWTSQDYKYFMSSLQEALQCVKIATEKIVSELEAI